MSWNLDADCRRRSRRTRYVFGRRGASPLMLTKPLCRAWPRRPQAPLPSVEALSAFAERASPGLREGCPNEERSRRNPSRLLPSTPTKSGPVGATPGPGRNVGAAPSTQNPAQCCQYAPLLDLAAYRDGMGARPDAESAAGGRPRYVRCAGCLLEVRGGAGDLVRYVALDRGCTSLALPTPSRPRDARG